MNLGKILKGIELGQTKFCLILLTLSATLIGTSCSGGPSYKSSSAKQVMYCKPRVAVTDDLRYSNPHRVAFTGECGVNYEIPIWK